MTSPQSMRPAQSHNLAIIKSHASKNGSEMALFFGGIRQAAVRRAHGDVAILAARSPWDVRTLHFLDRTSAGEGPEVGIGDPGELFYKKANFRSVRRLGELELVTFDGIQEVTSSF